MDVGVIGTGIMGRNHVRVYSELKEVGDLYIYDTNLAGASDVAKGSDIKVATTLDELVQSVEAISLCVPTQYHYSLAKELVNKGVGLLIEKPICQTSEEGNNLFSLIKEGVTIGVGHIERFNPIVQEIKKIISNPLYVEFKRHNPASSRNNTGSVVEDLMIHDIDIVTNCLFDKDDFSFVAKGSEDVAAVLGKIGFATISLSASRKSSKKIRMVHIEQEDMTIQGDFMSQEVYVYRKPGRYSIENERYVQENIVEKVLVAKREPLLSELKTFLSCIKDNRAFPVKPKEAVANVRICEEINRLVKNH
jgi:predicted dehydrogenase